MKRALEVTASAVQVATAVAAAFTSSSPSRFPSAPALAFSSAPAPFSSSAGVTKNRRKRCPDARKHQGKRDGKNRPLGPGNNAGKAPDSSVAPASGEAQASQPTGESFPPVFLPSP